MISGTPDDHFPTWTSRVQADTEALVLSAIANKEPFNEAETVAYLCLGLNGLEQQFSSLDSSRPWLCYWILHSLALLRKEVSEDEKARTVAFLRRCQCPSGGFGGGPMQLAHTAPTYAAVMGLVTVGTVEALQSIDRPRLYRYLLSLKTPEGGFCVHEDGEADSRGLYTVLAVAALTNILTPQLRRGCADWVSRLQGFDGGLGGEPGNESHGGYAYCALAAMVLTGEAETALDLDALQMWLCQRQMSVEGGFQGRTNKLVDSCYSFWQGACFALLRTIRPDTPWLDDEALADYVLGACTHARGGFRDKPGTNRDFYHTCYALSGLAVTARGEEHRLDRTDPVFNVQVDKLARAQAFFQGFACVHEDLLAAGAAAADDE